MTKSTGRNGAGESVVRLLLAAAMALAIFDLGGVLPWTQWILAILVTTAAVVAVPVVAFPARTIPKTDPEPNTEPNTEPGKKIEHTDAKTEETEWNAKMSTSIRQPPRRVFAWPGLMIAMILWSLFQTLPMPWINPNDRLPIPVESLIQPRPTIATSGARTIASDDSAAPRWAINHSISIRPLATRHQAAVGSIAGVALLVVVLVVRTQRQVQSMLLAIFALGILFSVVGLLPRENPRETAFGIPFSSGTCFATIINRNTAAQVLNLSAAAGWVMVVISAVRAAGVHRYQKRTQVIRRNVLPLVPGLVGLAIIGLGILACGSRGGLVTAVAGMTALLVWSLRYTTRRLLPILSIVAVILPAILVIAAITGLGVGTQIEFETVDRLASTDWSPDADSTFDGGDGDRQVRYQVVSRDPLARMLDGRLRHWPDAWRTAKAFAPLGSGLASYRDAYLPYQQTSGDALFAHAENVWLEWVVEWGWIGAFAILLGICFTYRTLRRSQADESTYGIGLSSGLVVLATSILVSQSLDFGLVFPSVALPSAIFLGLTTRMLAERRVAKLGKRKRSPMEQFLGSLQSRIKQRIPSLRRVRHRNEKNGRNATTGGSEMTGHSPSLEHPPGSEVNRKAPTAGIATPPEPSPLHGLTKGWGRWWRQPVQPSTTVAWAIVAVIGGLWAVGQLARDAQTAELVQTLKYIDPQTSPDAWQAAVAALDDAVDRRPMDPDLAVARIQAALANARLMTARQRSIDQSKSLDSVWPSVRIAGLRLAAGNQRRAGEVTDAWWDELGVLAPARDELRRAQRLAKQMLLANPISLRGHGYLAMLDFIDPLPSPYGGRLIQRWQTLQSRSPRSLIQIGRVALANHEVEVAAESFSAATAKSAHWVRPVLLAIEGRQDISINQCIGSSDESLVEASRTVLKQWQRQRKSTRQDTQSDIRELSGIGENGKLGGTGIGAPRSLDPESPEFRLLARSLRPLINQAMAAQFRVRTSRPSDLLSQSPESPWNPVGETNSRAGRSLQNDPTRMDAEQRATRVMEAMIALGRHAEALAFVSRLDPVSKESSYYEKLADIYQRAGMTSQADRVRRRAPRR